MIRAIQLLLSKLPAFAQARRTQGRGQTLIEYALLLFFLAIVVIAALLVLGPTVSGIFRSVNDQV
ncbi:MAG: Flp family type IVb pilin [Chloroflexota bacterium]|nr:Flp family type IVb pilin [Chloroflexota bacterium]